jgi:hypothetical protein
MSDTDLKPRTKPKPKVQKPRLYKVILLNDDYTPREFVVTVLKAVFKITDGCRGDQGQGRHRRRPEGRISAFLLHRAGGIGARPPEACCFVNLFRRRCDQSPDRARNRILDGAADPATRGE